MALFGSFRIAPGVRLSTSSRGLRAHVGPRVARVHVGGGRAGISTGAGPFTAYSGLGGSQQSRARSVSTSGMTPAQAEKAKQVEEVAAAWDELSRLHLSTFPEVTAPSLVAAEPVPMFGVLLREAERRALEGLGRFDRAARVEARERARSEAEAEALLLLDAGLRDHAARQEASDRAWSQLVAGEPSAVAAAVGQALSSRGLGVVVDSDRVGQVAVELEVPRIETIPTHRPDVTPKGMPTLKKLTKTELAHHDRQLVAARVLLAAKEALAQSRAIGVVAVVARRDGKDMIRTRLSRHALEGADWSLGAWDVLSEADPAVEADVGGRTQELRPLK